MYFYNNYWLVNGNKPLPPVGLWMEEYAKLIAKHGPGMILQSRYRGRRKEIEVLKPRKQRVSTYINHQRISNVFKRKQRIK
jgi:hypothetical protein